MFNTNLHERGLGFYFTFRISIHRGLKGSCGYGVVQEGQSVLAPPRPQPVSMPVVVKEHLSSECLSEKFTSGEDGMQWVGIFLLKYFIMGFYMIFFFLLFYNNWMIRWVLGKETLLVLYFFAVQSNADIAGRSPKEPICFVRNLKTY